MPKLHSKQKTPWTRRFFASFVHAGRGVKAAFLREVNTRVFAVIAVIVIALGFYYGISGLEWLALIIVVGLNFVAEFFNTALEVLCDKITMRRDKMIQVVKDISAAAVLIFAITALIVGITIFLPKILAF